MSHDATRRTPDGKQPRSAACSRSTVRPGGAGWPLVAAGFIVAVGMAPINAHGTDSTKRHSETSVDVISTSPARTLSACGWWLESSAPKPRRTPPTEIGPDARGALAGWRLHANRVSARGIAISDIGVGPASRYCELVATGRIRILSPDGRYITGTSLTAYGSPATELVIWGGDRSGGSASLVGDGWRLHGTAVFVDISTGAVRVIEPIS